MTMRSLCVARSQVIGLIVSREKKKKLVHSISISPVFNLVECMYLFLHMKLLGENEKEIRSVYFPHFSKIGI
jgi:hypothetical protein